MRPMRSRSDAHATDADSGSITPTLSPENRGEGTKPRARHPAAFLIVCIIALATWGVLLPWLGRQPSIAAMIDRNDTLGIDPSAKFYTETESTQHAQTRLASMQRRHPAALWSSH
ncbi:MAG TPA: hypothetical protein VM165_06280 [Planctomycetaceae bacterium]|nr:hypothetical protein [Planctomycetaceae bacterium]